MCVHIVYFEDEPICEANSIQSIPPPPLNLRLDSSLRQTTLGVFRTTRMFRNSSNQSTEWSMTQVFKDPPRADSYVFDERFGDLLVLQHDAIRIT